MSRTFKTADYDATLDLTVRLGDCLPPDHLARFVVDTIAQLDLAAIYDRYGTRGGQPYAPEILLALLFYGYATGTFSSRKIERATFETVPFRVSSRQLAPRSRYPGDLSQNVPARTEEPVRPGAVVGPGGWRAEAGEH
jgi:transposase